LAADLSSASADATWHTPKAETAAEQRANVGRDSVAAPTSEVSAAAFAHAPSAVRGSPDPARTTLSETWAAFSFADSFPDPVELDFASFTQPHAHNSLSLGTLDDARIHSSPNDIGGSSSGSAAGSPVSAGSAGSLMFDPLNLGNGLSGLVSNGSAGGASLTASPSLSSSLPPGVLALTTPVANAPGSPNAPVTNPNSSLITHDSSPGIDPNSAPPPDRPLLLTGQGNDPLPDLGVDCT